MAKAKTRSGSGKRSKQKGSTQELKVSKLLGSWWGNGATFRRTPGSGGWARRQEDDVFGAKGDIVCSDNSYPFCTEIKHYRDVRVDALLDGTNPPLMTWWQQAVDQCPSNLFPLLIFKRNGVPERAVFSYSQFPDHHCSIAELIKDMNYFKFRRPNKDTLFIVTLKDFLTIDPKILAFEPQEKLLNG